MRIYSSTRLAALAALTGALACASNKARTEDTAKPSEAAAARDTTNTGRDTTQNPAGYRGMERDTTMAPEHQQTPTDTFLQRQGTGAPQDTSGYSGVERVDTTGQGKADTTGQANPTEVNPSAGQVDTTGGAGVGRDTSGMSGMDTTQMRNGLDSTGTSRTGDTTGYNRSQDTTTSR
jgi:hypothetical protein